MHLEGRRGEAAVGRHSAFGAVRRKAGDLHSATVELGFNHNMETVPRLYRTIRPGARFEHSLSILAQVKKHDPMIFTKSGIMVGLGESDEEVASIMDDLRGAEVDFMTIGQYLQPTPKHAPVARFVTPNMFSFYEGLGEKKGFLLMASTPLTRSSYHADADFAALRLAREKKLSI